MSAKTGIEWTDATWNPIRGCSRVSEGCRHCYAETTAQRFSGPGGAYEGLVRIEPSREGVAQRKGWSGTIKFVEEHLLDPLHWKTPRRIFVNSMSDLFHENVTDEMRDRIFAVMALCSRHTFQVLTKRPWRTLTYINSRMGAHVSPYIEALNNREWFPGKVLKMSSLRVGSLYPAFPLPNVWLGVSVENQAAADERIPLLLQTPAAVRFISAEPLLGPVDLTAVSLRAYGTPEGWTGNMLDNLAGSEPRPGMPAPMLDWVICGGESGPGARPMHPDWARSLRDQCSAAGVPFFFKQWGEWVPWQLDGGFSELKSQAGKLMDRHALPEFDDSDVKGWTDDLLYDGEDIAVHQRVGKKAAGHELDGKVWHQFPAPAVRG